MHLLGVGFKSEPPTAFLDSPPVLLPVVKGMGRKGPENWLGLQCVGAEPQIHVQDSIFDIPGCAFWAPFLTEFSLGSVRQPSLCLFLQTQNILLSSFPACLEQ